LERDILHYKEFIDKTGKEYKGVEKRKGKRGGRKSKFEPKKRRMCWIVGK